MRRALLVLILGTALLGACVSTKPPKAVPGTGMKGNASWYGQEFAGRTTANGEIFDPLLLTAAHRTLPFGTVLQVKNPKNGHTVNVRVNDRGPFIGDRIIDLSYAAAEQLGLIDAGVGPVELTIVKVGAGEHEPPAPYVVNASSVAPKPAPAPKPADASAPPPVPFPLPPDAAAAPAGEEPFHVAVQEERGGVEVRKQVGPDGRTIETVPTSEPSPAPPQPAAPPTPAKPLTPAAPPPAAGTFVVQLGAFREEKNAAELRDRVAAVIDKVAVSPNESMYRVRVGPYATRAAAIDAREKLENAGFSGIVMPAEK